MVRMKQCVKHETNFGLREPTYCLTSGTDSMLHARFAEGCKQASQYQQSPGIWYSDGLSNNEHALRSTFTRMVGLTARTVISFCSTTTPTNQCLDFWKSAGIARRSWINCKHARNRPFRTVQPSSHKHLLLSQITQSL